MTAARVVPGELHGLHHRLGSRHVEGDFVQAGNLQQAPHIGGGDRMVGPQHGTQLPHPGAAAFDALLVEIVAEHVHAVGSREVVEAVAVQIGEKNARRGLEKHAGLEMLADHPAELERHTIPGGELQVGHGAGDFGRQRRRLRAMSGKMRGEAHEACAPQGRNRRRRRVGGKKTEFVVFVERHEPGEAARHLRVSGQRPMFGTRQLQAQPRLVCQRDHRDAARQIPENVDGHGFPPPPRYVSRVTLR